ncbi:TIGR04255 family protein [Mycobacterium sp. M1]|uniref:TIGR04255 family protein n=1 Tax=Mycolicibacter acidiphilus TaxID=2835306 RepID=A0ABS5RDM9_9MYCO|nr:TIGR04255 family protein [Mycolicibacter acidiphilus]MBS9532393.1 TIGR04255 family protein [Mycolicibacter acidiphilus]
MGDMAAVGALPSFEKPPVVEVAVGVHFLQLPGLDTVALVRLVDKWRERFPKVRQQAALPPPGPQAAFTFQVGNAAPLARLWALTEDESLLIQVQHDRVLVNWRKQSGDAPYPRYDVLRGELSSIWGDFERYVESAQFGVLRPTAAEVAFFNRIPVGSAADISRVIDALSPNFVIDGLAATRLQMERQLSRADGQRHGSQTISLSYPADENNLQLEIASMVAVDAELSSSDVLGALDTAHAEGVRTFERFTTESAHVEWEKS